MNNPTVSLSVFRRDHGEVIVQAFLAREIRKLCDFVNVGKNMSDQQIAETVKLIIQTYYFLSLLDFKLFFTRLKQGFYGSFYDRMDGSLILEKLLLYEQERAQEFENKRMDEHRLLRKSEDDSGISINAEIVKHIKQAVENMSLSKKPNPVLREKTREEMRFQRWMKQFDNLSNKFGENRAGLRIIKINNNRFTVETFLQQKIQNLEKWKN